MATAQPSVPATTGPSKPIHSLVLDTGPLIKNDPSASILISKAEQLYILPSIISEIRDVATRSRVETTILPFVEVRSPRPASIQFVQGFARRTGDLAVLSRPDIEVIALAYELECERNGGDWRLRNTPGQQRLNGRPPHAQPQDGDAEASEKAQGDSGSQEQGAASTPTEASKETPPESADLDSNLAGLRLDDTQPNMTAENLVASEPGDVSHPSDGGLVGGEKEDENAVEVDGSEDDEDEDGWITPSNLKKHMEKDTGNTAPGDSTPQKTLQAALLTSDYAMQNVALRMNLNLLSPSLSRITYLKNWVLRCHGCFTVTKQMERQFCPSCGQPTLLRTSCSTDAQGNFKIHLKQNFQWNNRGNVYSVPKPIHGSSNGKMHKTTTGGGQNGWGRDLMLAEDQKEFTRAKDEQRRQGKKDLMDDDRLPSILSGDRPGQGRKIRVGAGRHVNSKRKH